jgi:beta-phosphoglucomutase
MRYENVIFDLDGVLVSTDEYHYQAWKKIADEEGIYFDRAINNRLRGVSRMASLEIILERAAKNYTQAEKEELAQRKNRYYQELLGNLTTEDTLNGVRETLADLRKNSVHIAVGSSSKNTMRILKQVGLENAFDAIADGTEITHSKPDPEDFLLAAQKLGAKPENCLVV